MIIVMLSCLYAAGEVFAEDNEIAGVQSPREKTMAGRRASPQSGQGAERENMQGSPRLLQPGGHADQGRQIGL